MYKPFKIFSVATTMAISIAVGAGTTAAHASPTPVPLSPASTMSAFDCPAGGLGNVNLATLEFTPAAAAQPCEFSGGYNESAYNPLDARIYSINVSGSVVTLVANDVQGRNLAAWPANANQKRQVISGTTTAATAIAINPLDGAAFVIDSSGKLYHLNLATGVASSPLTTSPNVGGAYYMAFNPDGVLYGFGQGHGDLFTINTTTGASTVVQSDWRQFVPNNDGAMHSLTFDANGNMFFSGVSTVQSTSDQGGEGIYSTTATNSMSNIGQFFLSPQNPTWGHPWTGTPTNQANVMAILITYGNLAVKFDSTGGSAQLPSNFYSKVINDSVTPHIVNPAIVLPAPTRAGFSFNGWFTSASGGTLIGLAGASYTPYSDVNINMYAQWTADELPHTGFDAAPYAVTSSILLALGLGVILIARRRKQN